MTLEDMENLSDLTWWNRGGYHGRRETWGKIDITQTDDCTQGKKALFFQTRIGKGAIIEKDLAAMDLDFGKFDLLKFDCKLEGGRVYLVIGLEHAPFANGRFIDWYPADSATEPFGWKTFSLDLKWPEEVKGVAPEGCRKLYIRVSPYETARTDEEPWRKLTFDNFRLVKKVIDVEWDQRKAPYGYNEKGDLVYTYDLHVANIDERPHTVVGSLDTSQLVHGEAEVERERFELQPGELIMFKVRVSLPAESLKGLKPLYCERVHPSFRAEDVPDSDATILRSSDPIPLTVTVPVPGKVEPPFVTEQAMKVYDARYVKPRAELALQGKVSLGLKEGELQYLRKGWIDDGDTVQHLGRLYLETREKRYAEAARRIILAYADGHKRRAGALRDRGGTGVQTIHATRFNSTTLSGGWFMRPLVTGYDAIHHSGVLSEADKRHILDDFFLPMAIIMRNHLIGLGNQQCEVNYVINYVGLLARNWPLVSFAYSSHEGLRSQIRSNFSEDGFASEGHYHYAVLIPLVNQAELMAQAGADVYDDDMKRLFTSYCEKLPLPHTHRINSQLRIAAKRYDDPILGLYAEDKYPPDLRAGHLPYYGYTCLRHFWDGDLRAAAINWAHQEYRSAPDRMAVEFYGLGRGVLGGREYNHSSLDQSTILVDMQDQDPQRGVVDYLDPEGEVQVVSVSTKGDAPLYPGVKIYRTVALIRGCLLSVDRAVSEKPHTYDWVQYLGGRQEMSLEFQECKKAWGKGHGYEKIVDAREAELTEPWSVAWGLDRKGEKAARVTHLPVGKTQALLGTKQPRGKNIFLLRAEGTSADWITFVEIYSKQTGPRLTSVKRLPVEIGGKETQEAVGMSLALDGKDHTILVNYTGQPATCAGLKSKERWTFR